MKANVFFSNMNHFRSVAAAFSISLLSQNSFAAEAASSGSESLTAVQFSDPTYLLQVFFSLLLVLGAILLLSYLVRKFELNPGGREGPIKILHSIGIGGKEQLMLIEVGGEQVLISRSPGNVRALHQLQRPVELNQQAATDAGMAGVFGKVLNREM